MLKRLLVLLLLCGIAALCGCGEEPLTTEPDNSAYLETIGRQNERISSLEQEVSEFESAPRSITVVKATVEVRAGRFQDYAFSVRADMSNAHIKGKFESVAGGPLYVYVMENADFQNYKGGGEFKVFYQSGKVVVGDVNVRLAPGSYHLVLSNTFSWITSKTVNADVELIYTSS